MVQNCERIKHEWAHEGGGAKRCFIYRSGSAPLQWQESAREVTNVPNRWYMLMQWATSPAPSRQRHADARPERLPPNLHLVLALQHELDAA